MSRGLGRIERTIMEAVAIGNYGKPVIDHCDAMLAAFDIRHTVYVPIPHPGNPKWSMGSRKEEVGSVELTKSIKVSVNRALRNLVKKGLLVRHDSTGWPKHRGRHMRWTTPAFAEQEARKTALMMALARR